MQGPMDDFRHATSLAASKGCVAGWEGPAATKRAYAEGMYR